MKVEVSGAAMWLFWTVFAMLCFKSCGVSLW
jgi:hypothetical protein